MAQNIKSGFVSICGRANVGKSTLMNALIGEKAAIVSSRPQTTRNQIKGIFTDKDAQVIFIDTPGVLTAKNKLNEYMVRAAFSAMRDMDAVMLVAEPYSGAGEVENRILSALKEAKCPVLLVLNKIDTIDAPALLKVIDEYSKAFPFAAIFPVSAATGENLDVLMDEIKKLLPVGPMYFPDGIFTDMPERALAAEFIREKALYLLRDEIPHGIAVEIMSMNKRQSEDIVDIEATIYCEKDSHKGIIIGKSGEMLKRIGSLARRDCEKLLGSRVSLKTWVKVKKGWRDSDFMLRNLGYDKKQI